MDHVDYSSMHHEQISRNQNKSQQFKLLIDNLCESLSFNNTPVDGKVVLCFTTVAAPTVIANSASAVKAAEGVGVIVARNPSDTYTLATGDNDFPCVVVDYELGTLMLFYIRSTRY